MGIFCRVQTITMPATMVTSDVSERKFLTKKRIVSAVVAVLVTAIVVVGIVVGIWIFTEQTRLMLQYTASLTGSDGTKSTQDVSTNMAENVVQYHVVKDNAEWWIVEDFNKVSVQPSTFTCNYLGYIVYRKNVILSCLSSN